MWTSWEKAWTNSRKVEIPQSHHEGLVFEACSRTTKLFSAKNYIGWKFRQSPTYPPSAGSDTWTPEIDTRSRLGAPNTISVKTKVWFLSRDDFEHTVGASRICTPFWPEVAQLTGSCEKLGKRLQDFIISNRSWWLYASFMFLVLLIGVLESQLNVFSVVNVILQNLKIKKYKNLYWSNKKQNSTFSKFFWKSISSSFLASYLKPNIT